MAKAHTCSYPGCDEEPMYDLVLSRRVDKMMSIGNASYISRTKETLEHLYLCPYHSLSMQDFLKLYTKEVSK